MHFSPVFASLLVALIGTPVLGQSSSSQSSGQSSQSQSQSSGQSATSTSSQPATSSAGGGGGGGGGGTQPPQQLIQGLQGAGFTGFASALNQISGNPGGNELFSKLQSSGGQGGNSNYLVFAPTDQALQNLPSSVTQNATLLADYLSYHFVRGQFDQGQFSNTTGGAGGGGSSSSSQSGGASSTSQSSQSTSGGGQSTSTGGGGGGQTGTSQTQGGQFSTPVPQTAAARDTSIFGRIFVPRQMGQGGQGGNDSDSGSGGSGGGGGGTNSSSGGGGGGQPFAGTWPNITIGRTLLNASEFVQLEGNQSQVLVWDRPLQNSNVTILNQATNVTVTNSTMQGNWLIAGINGTLIPPGNLSTALAAVNATAAQNFLQSVQIPGPDGTNTSALQALQSARGITLFVPNNAAFTSQVNNTLQSIQSNSSAVAALLQNHYVNGTTIYSTQISDDSEAVTAAGEDLDFSKNSTGIFVEGGNGTTAEIVRPDVLVSNGVIHIIDRVLYDTDSDQSAAQAAYTSASSIAAKSATASGPITSIIGGGVGGGGGTSTQSGSQSSQTQSSQSSQSQSQSSQTSQSSQSTQSNDDGSSQTSGGGGDTNTVTATATTTT